MKIERFLLFIFIIKLAYSQIPDFDEKKTFDLAFDYYLKNDNYRAITEFKRYIFFGRDKFKIDKARLMMGLSYFKGGNYEKAFYILENISEDDKNYFQEESFIKLGDILLENEFKKVVIYKHYEFDYPKFSDKYYLSYISKYKEGKYFKEAYFKFLLVQLLNFDTKRFYNFLNREEAKIFSDEELFDLKRKGREISNLKKKSKFLAGFLSIIPGMGQIYAGEVKEGLIAFLVNISVGFLGYYSYVNYSKLIGVILFYYEFSYYIGNFSNAINAVEKFNENERNRYRNYLLNLYYKKF